LDLKDWIKSKRKFVILAIALAVVVAAAVAIYIVADSFLGNIGQLDPQATLSSEQLATIFGEGETVETDPVLEEAETIFKDNDVVNILLVGQDRRGGTEPERTDAMILCTINKSAKTLTMTSFMRDLWLYIPDHYNQRLNYPYQLGGFELLNKTLDYNFGVSADYNVEIDFSGFMQTIDMVGGVEIELTDAEAKYLNKRGNWDVEDNTDWELKEGVNLLNGSQALAYSRIRKIGTDFGRTNRQRTVLTELVEKAKELDTKEMYTLAKEIMPLLRTDMSKAQIFGLILDLVPILSEIEVISQRIPMDGQYSYANKNGADVIVMSKSQQETNKELIASAMRVE
jgi:LCP family protein required for cell wall assembly